MAFSSFAFDLQGFLISSEFPDRRLFFCNFRQAHQVILDRKWRTALRRTNVFSVGLQKACLHVVIQIGLQDLIAQTLLQVRLADWKDHLAALDQVARHPVGAAAIDFVFAAIGIMGVGIILAIIGANIPSLPTVYTAIGIMVIGMLCHIASLVVRAKDARQWRIENGLAAPRTNKRPSDGQN